MGIRGETGVRAPHGPAAAAPDAWTVATAPGGIPLLGHALALWRRPLAFLAALPAHGDLVAIRLGPQRVWLACDPALVQQILMDPRTYDKGGPLYDTMRMVLGNGLVTCPQNVHRRQRRLAQPCFRPSRIADYATVMSDEIGAAVGQWRPGRTLDVTDAMLDLSARVTTGVLMSTSLAPGVAAEVRGCLATVMRGVLLRAVVPLGPFYKLPTRGNRRFDRALSRLHHIIDGIIAERRASTAGHDDLLATLLEATDDEPAPDACATGRGPDRPTAPPAHQEAPHAKEPLTDQEAHDQLMTFLVAGIETTALALAWTFHLLAAHPEEERRLHAELDAVLAGRPPVPADLPRLGRARRVVTEALRMYPPGWALTRVTTTETTLAGHRLAPGSTVLYSAYVLHQDPVAFPDPQRFDPDRWLPERAGSVPSGAMLPFAAGNRKCIGDHFAMTEAVLALAAIAARWRLRPPSARTVRPVPAAVLSPGPLPMVCELRSRPDGAAPAVPSQAP
ncbi:cytochrome P450 [Streptomyces sp. CB02923]|uniref:cytochrome P450 n=1 Tax=Streptomyces sp. CB02923 TaxID=1718985 RepID=UPI00093C4F53|nr:cytochrome P450 [Streptomyces sp. CB02923]OKH98067.1 cytochrome P450 [Streptomyces sp. CB02923]